MYSRGGFTEGRGRGARYRGGGWNSSSRGHGRGGGRGRGRGDNRSQAFYQPQTPISRSSEPLGPTIGSINIKSLLVDEENPKIEDCEYVASYNWSSGNATTILVPGLFCPCSFPSPGFSLMDTNEVKQYRLASSMDTTYYRFEVES